MVDIGGGEVVAVKDRVQVENPSTLNTESLCKDSRSLSESDIGERVRSALEQSSGFDGPEGLFCPRFRCYCCRAME